MWSCSKHCCLLLSGVILVTLADQQSDASGSSESGKTAGRSFFGDLLCIASSCLYAGYTTVMRRKLPDEHSAASVAGFLGYVGLFTALFLAPVVAIGIATGALPVTSIPRDAYGLIAAEGFLDYVLSDYLWAMAVIALGPTIATLGLSIQIPVSRGYRDVPACRRRVLQPSDRRACGIVQRPATLLSV